MKRNSIDKYLIPLAPADYPHLHETVGHYASKAGLEMPTLYKVNHQTLGNDLLSKMIDSSPSSAFRDQHGKLSLVFSENTISAIGLPTLKEPVHEELKAVICHEFGHMKRGDLEPLGTLRLSTHTPLAALVAGLGVVGYLHYHSHQKHKEETAKGLETPHHSTSPTLNSAVWAGKYILGGVFGLGAGLFAARHMRYKMEYACDAFSKELMGSGEPLKAFFTRFSAFVETTKDALLKEGKLDAHQLKKGSRIERFFHPPIEKRIERI